ncbi:FecR domain-containing protein [Methylopila sp. M107]|uniref:FecR domain-containing protein n=1 Tax=Methylopila sp. M107 TaxID=1101190 RepID=UPI0003A375C3|nr:FecR domain-containing protein [Methylopila sp. M107]
MAVAYLRYLGTAAAIILCSTTVRAQAPFDRPQPYAAEVIAIKGGEELQLRTEADWRNVVLDQRLIGGDALRTNAFGNLAILFEDRTQIRLGRNSTLLVKEVARGPNGETQLSLTRGSMWARAARGGSGVTVDTPAAAAAIRGTDWSLSVEGKKTGLIVLDGEVVLANKQGSVTVRRGEAAEAVVGQAPRKITIVNFDRREQIQIYRDLSDSFSEVTPTIGTRAEERAERGRALARPEGSRSAEDWLTLAEAGLTYDGPKAAGIALGQARARGLSSSQRARADLVQCMIDARARRWAKAAALCEDASRRLDGGRRDTAAYLGWAARSMADPSKRTPMPDASRYAHTPQGLLARASIESFVFNTKRGVELVDEGIKRYPNDVMMRAGKGLLHIMAADKEAAKAAIDGALAVDPDDPYALVASARYKWTVESDLEGALKALKRAQEIAPGADFVWLETSLVQDAREATHEAEAAHIKAIELDPDDPVNRSNYAVFLMEHGRLQAAETELKAAEAIDPGGFFNLYTRGFLELSRGQAGPAVEKLLAASTIAPQASSTQIALAIANYQAGATVEAEQALDNADQFDDDDPVTPMIRSVIAVDRYRADEAIESAREALRRREARGGDFATIDANRQNGSFVASSLRFLQLDEWARYYGDRVADAFTSSAYFDQAIVNRVDPFAAATTQSAPDALQGGVTSFSSLVQGMLIDPLAIASSERNTTLVYHPFAEVAAGGGFVTSGGKTGWVSDTSINAMVMEPFPVAVYANAAFDRPESRYPNDRDDNATGTLIVGAKPTAYDSLSLFNITVKNREGARLFDRAFEFWPIFAKPDRERSFVTVSGAAWSHEFSDRNIVQALVAGTSVDQKSVSTDPFTFDSDGDLVPDSIIGLDRTQKLKQREIFGGVSHLFGVGDVTVKYGAEGAAQDIRLTQSTLFLDRSVIGTRDRPDGEAWRVYADAVWDVTKNLKIEGGLFGSSVKIGSAGGDDRFDPRIGVAFQPIDGQWLRGAYRKDSLYSSVVTLSPITTVGITPIQTPVSFGGRTETLAARWDSEWSRYLFTSLDYQRQKVEGLSIGVPESVRSADIARADVDQLTASANIWLTHGLGAFASYTRSWSETKELNGDYFYRVEAGDPVPFLPKHYGRVGLAFVHPAMWKVTVAQNFVGARQDSLGQKLDYFSTTDATATWELFDKRLSLGLQALNIFDQKIENFGRNRRAPIALPAPIGPLAAIDRGELLGAGRTVTATARVRF